MTIEQVVVGLFFAGVSFILKMIFDRISKNEKDLKDFRKEVGQKICDQYDLIRVEYKALSSKMEINKKEILDTIAVGNKSNVSQTLCDVKQELWSERFNAMMSRFDQYIIQNEKEHGRIIDTMTHSASAGTQQMVDLSERISELSDCVKNLQMNREC